MRAIGRLLATLVVLAVLAIGADFALTAYAERRASALISDRLGAPAVVELSGWPVTLGILGGSVERADVMATDIPLEGTEARLQRLDATLLGVSTDLPDWRGSTSGIPPARAGTFTAVLGTEDVRRLVRLPDTASLARLVLAEDVVRLELGGLAALDATLAVEDGQLILRPTAPLLDLARIPLDLPPLPAGAVITRAEVEDGEVRLLGTLTGG